MSNEKPLLAISSFGGFSIATLDTSSPGYAPAALSTGKGSAKKLWTLVEYLIFSGKESATFDELIELLWPDEGGAENPLASLRLLVHRARAELDKLGVCSGSEMIVRQDKSYRWNRRLNIQIDTEQFEELYTHSRSGSALERLEALMKAAELYKGRFLPKATQYQWAMVLDTYYHSKYIAICEEAVALLAEFRRTWDIIELCRKAVAIDPYAETLHVAFIKALTEAGSFNAALEHYKRITDMFMKEFGITPSEGLKAVYKILSRHTNELESDISVIREALSESESEGAFELEYELFKQVCQLKTRESMRSGQVVQLALISLTPAGGKMPGQRSKTTYMDRLGEVIQSSLRQGDMYTRYSVQQYLALLQSANYENGLMVLDRIEHNFKLAYPRSGYLIQYKLLPLLAKEPEKDNSLMF